MSFNAADKGNGGAVSASKTPPYGGGTRSLVGAEPVKAVLTGRS